MEVHYIEWHVTPFRRDRFIAIWQPALDRALAFGAGAAYLTRSEDDPLHLRQVTTWESRSDQQRWWFSDELSALRQEAFAYYHKPVEQHWHATVADAAVQASNGHA
jgi:heme-degrading monooxygenase HmoA